MLRARSLYQNGRVHGEPSLDPPELHDPNDRSHLTEDEHAAAIADQLEVLCEVAAELSLLDEEDLAELICQLVAGFRDGDNDYPSPGCEPDQYTAWRIGKEARGVRL